MAASSSFSTASSPPSSSLVRLASGTSSRASVSDGAMAGDEGGQPIMHPSAGASSTLGDAQSVTEVKQPDNFGLSDENMRMFRDILEKIILAHANMDIADQMLPKWMEQNIALRTQAIADFNRKYADVVTLENKEAETLLSKNLEIKIHPTFSTHPLAEILTLAKNIILINTPEVHKEGLLDPLVIMFNRVRNRKQQKLTELKATSEALEGKRADLRPGEETKERATVKTFAEKIYTDNYTSEGRHIQNLNEEFLIQVGEFISEQERRESDTGQTAQKIFEALESKPQGKSFLKTAKEWYEITLDLLQLDDPAFFVPLSGKIFIDVKTLLNAIFDEHAQQTPIVIFLTDTLKNAGLTPEIYAHLTVNRIIELQKESLLYVWRVRYSQKIHSRMVRELSNLWRAVDTLHEQIIETGIPLRYSTSAVINNITIETLHELARMCDDTTPVLSETKHPGTRKKETPAETKTSFVPLSETETAEYKTFLNSLFPRKEKSTSWHYLHTIAEQSQHVEIWIKIRELKAALDPKSDIMKSITQYIRKTSLDHHKTDLATFDEFLLEIQHLFETKTLRQMFPGKTRLTPEQEMIKLLKDQISAIQHAVSQCSEMKSVDISTQINAQTLIYEKGILLLSLIVKAALKNQLLPILAPSDKLACLGSDLIASKEREDKRRATLSVASTAVASIRVTAGAGISEAKQDILSVIQQIAADSKRIGVHQILTTKDLIAFFSQKERPPQQIVLVAMTYCLVGKMGDGIAERINFVTNYLQGHKTHRNMMRKKPKSLTTTHSIDLSINLQFNDGQYKLSLLYSGEKESINTLDQIKKHVFLKNIISLLCGTADVPLVFDGEIIPNSKGWTPYVKTILREGKATTVIKISLNMPHKFHPTPQREALVLAKTQSLQARARSLVTLISKNIARLEKESTDTFPYLNKKLPELQRYIGKARISSIQKLSTHFDEVKNELFENLSDNDHVKRKKAVSQLEIFKCVYDETVSVFLAKPLSETTETKEVFDAVDRFLEQEQAYTATNSPPVTALSTTTSSSAAETKAPLAIAIPPATVASRLSTSSSSGATPTATAVAIPPSGTSALDASSASHPAVSSSPISPSTRSSSSSVSGKSSGITMARSAGVTPEPSLFSSSSSGSSSSSAEPITIQVSREYMLGLLTRHYRSQSTSARPTTSAAGVFSGSSSSSSSGSSSSSSAVQESKPSAGTPAPAAPTAPAKSTSLFSSSSSSSSSSSAQPITAQMSVEDMLGLLTRYSRSQTTAARPTTSAAGVFSGSLSSSSSGSSSSSSAAEESKLGSETTAPAAPTAPAKSNR